MDTAIEMLRTAGSVLVVDWPSPDVPETPAGRPRGDRQGRTGAAGLGCWATEADSREAPRIAESDGLAYVGDVYIADAVRALGAPERAQ